MAVGRIQGVIGVGVRRFEMFQTALAGDDEPLRRSLGAGGLAAVAPHLRSVFVVEDRPDGQKATLGMIRDGGGMESYEDVPNSFRIARIEHDEEHWILHAADGRVLRATPEQLSNVPRVLNEECNPRYEEHLTQVWAAIPRLDTDGGDAAAAAVCHELLGPERDLNVSFLFNDPERVRELMPNLRRIAAEFERIHRTGVEYLWECGAEEGDTEDDKARFREVVKGTDIEIYYSGDFILHYDGGGYFMDGYWPAIHFRAEDATPVMFSVEA